MKNVLLIYSHPWPHKSRYNRTLQAAVSKLPFVEIRDLYELYPNLHIDEAAEQEALLRADIIAFQFPIYWYSAPALLKEWQDTVLQSGFAFGDGGTALKGKQALFAVSTGSPPSSYRMDELHGAPLESFLLPFQMTARFCGMKEPRDPFVTYAASSLNYDAVRNRAREYAALLKSMAAKEST